MNPFYAAAFIIGNNCQYILSAVWSSRLECGRSVLYQSKYSAMSVRAALTLSQAFVFHVAPYPLHKDIVPAMPSCQPRSRRGEEGFSSCLAHPCQHAVGFTALKETVASVRLRRVLLPSPVFCGLGLRSLRFSRPHRRSLALRPGDSRLSRG